MTEEIGKEHCLPGPEKLRTATAKAEQNVEEVQDWQEIPNLWMSGEPHQSNTLKPEGDMHAKLLEPLLEKDKMQIQAWKDEVQNLLIFAGLFSAVLTAFVIESYKRLQRDSNDTVLALLTRIADRLDGLINAGSGSGTRTGPWLSQLAPAPASMRINIFWFMSLSLSLTTVLIGIVTLQWIREYQHYDLSPRAMNKFNLRLDGTKRWYMPRIVAALPLLLRVALLVFFIGIADVFFTL